MVSFSGKDVSSCEEVKRLGGYGCTWAEQRVKGTESGGHVSVEESESEEEIPK